MKKETIEITVFCADSPSELPATDATLLQMATRAMQQAYAPYSHFRVGAAVLLENGEIVCGSNQENVAYPSGLCAERVALFYANAQFPNVPVRAIAINAGTDGHESIEPVYPCGSCRQVLLECEMRSGNPIRIIMGSTRKIQVVDCVGDLLPLSFTG
ncbi:MAG: cytidine deaminase [Prevotellaceae bacterium]|jgi:cytidine deaminase|nr:cytidine deaminase [Prevotellaceae bacterium]